MGAFGITLAGRDSTAALSASQGSSGDTFWFGDVLLKAQRVHVRSSSIAEMAGQLGGRLCPRRSDALN